ncbi:CRISPR-associated endonuclease Cas2 [Candidatus Gottesmanbacteria bacterium]|nr:CRISPR-associated endonuclease Cas2 [Candidatus Gottesmanbacteria bacterium]
MKRKKQIRNISRAGLKLAEGLFSHTVDMSLWFIVYLSSMSFPQKTTGQLWRAQIAADQFINQINYDVIKQAIVNAKRKGYIKKSRRHAWPEITQAGKHRLASLLPQYDEKRAWDDRMHLVTYDIPEKRRKDRALLREYLNRIGCGRLQDSVWLTPYNPIDTIRSFIEKRGLRGTVIVSDLGKDGSVGEEDLAGLLVRLYRLDAVNKHYEEWLNDVKSHGVDHWHVIRYLAILKEDPQLPFALLPAWWKGEVAHRKVRGDLQRLLVN